MAEAGERFPLTTCGARYGFKAEDAEQWTEAQRIGLRTEGEKQ